MSVGEHIRKKREELGISLRDAAKMIECSPTYMSRVENGKETKLSDQFLTRICEYMCLDKDEMFIMSGQIPSDVLQFLLKNPKRLSQIRGWM